MHTLQIQGIGAALKVVQFSGTESLSELFHFDVTAVTAEAAIDVRAVTGLPATLTISAHGLTREIKAIVRRVEVSEATLTVGASYHFELVPAHMRLALRRDARIFQSVTAVDVIEKVVKGAGLEISVLVSASYPVREYCVQYRETDWDFISRLAEDEGITLYFSPGKSDSVLVLADASPAHFPIDGETTLRFRPDTGALASGEQVSRIRWAEEYRSGKSTLRDYNFKKPSLLVEGQAKAESDDDLELYDYPGLHDSPGGGKALARIRQEAEEARRSMAQGESNSCRLVPGSTFHIAEHPRDEVNAEWLVTRVTSEGADPQMFAGEARTSFECRFEVMPASKPHRPARVTPRPKIVGLQTAIVVGPEGEEIHVDEYGRVKVHFHWDRLGKKDDKSSCWIRVAQAWAGPGFGAIAIPRVGHEVVVGFLEGDPDRPLITGSVYHGANAPPYALPADKTRTAIRTASTPNGGGGHNELRFEDRKGLEEIFLRAEKDVNVEVLHDRGEHIGHDETVKIDNDRSHTVGMNAVEKVGVDKTVEVGANHTEIVGANLTVNVGANIVLGGSGALTFTLKGDSDSTVEGSTRSSISKDVEESVGGAKKESVGGDQSIAVSGEHELKVDKDASISVGGSATEAVEKSKSITVGETYTLECGDGSVTVKKNGDIEIKGKSIKIKGSGPISIEGSKLQVKSDGTIDLNASGAVKVKGSAVDLN